MRDWYAFPAPSQGSCLQSEERLSLQINLSAHGDRPTDLDKLKPYVIEHILVLLMAPAAGPAAGGGFASPVRPEVWMQISSGNVPVFKKGRRGLSSQMLFVFGC